VEAINPGFHCVAIVAEGGDQELASPAVVAYGLHGGRPKLRAVLAVENLTGNQVVAVAEDVSLHHDGFTYDPLDRESPTIDFG